MVDYQKEVKQLKKQVAILDETIYELLCTTIEKCCRDDCENCALSSHCLDSEECAPYNEYN